MLNMEKFLLSEEAKGSFQLTHLGRISLILLERRYQQLRRPIFPMKKLKIVSHPISNFGFYDSIYCCLDDLDSYP